MFGVGGNPWLSELCLMCMEGFYLFTSPFSLLAPDKAAGLSLPGVDSSSLVLGILGDE